MKNKRGKSKPKAKPVKRSHRCYLCVPDAHEFWPKAEDLLKSEKIPDRDKAAIRAFLDPDQSESLRAELPKECGISALEFVQILGQDYYGHSQYGGSTKTYRAQHRAIKDRHKIIAELRRIADLIEQSVLPVFDLERGWTPGTKELELEFVRNGWKGPPEMLPMPPMDIKQAHSHAPDMLNSIADRFKETAEAVRDEVLEDVPSKGGRPLNPLLEACLKMQALGRCRGVEANPFALAEALNAITDASITGEAIRELLSRHSVKTLLYGDVDPAKARK